MRLKAINGFLALTGTFFALSSGTFVNTTAPGTNTVPIIFSSGDGKFSDGSSKKVYEVRKGIKWSDLKEGYEKPSKTKNEVIPPTSSLTFDGTWLDSDGVSIDANLLNKDSKYYNYTITESITVYANYGAESFATMTWSKLANFFNGKGNTKNNTTYTGTSGLASYFGYTYSNHSCPELIGQERYLNYAGEQRKVVVIGFNQDKIDDDKGWGSITFQFVDTITDAPFNYNEDNKYDGSHLETYLNNAVYNNIEEDVRNQIKEVKKWTYCKDSGKVEMKKEKLFPLSLREMNVDSPAAHGTAKVEGLLNDGGDAQTVSYHFYAKTNGVYDFPKSGEGRANADPVKKTDINGNASSYWLRSYDNVADTAYNVDHSYIVDEDGNVGKTQRVNYTCGVAPAFCFGQCNIVKESFTTCDWSTIINIINTARNRTDGTQNSGLKDLKEAFSDDDDNQSYKGYFVGLKRDLIVNGNTYQVRVIGEEHDNLKASYNGINKAALTFELVQVVSGTDGKAITEYFGKDNCNNFINDGKIFGVLNGDNGKKGMPSIVKDNLREVTKWYNYAKKASSSDTGISSYNTYVFPFSFKEVGGYIGDGNWKVDVPNQADVYWKKKQTSGISSKSTVYKYYEDTVSSSQMNDKRIKKDINGNSDCHYYLGEMFENRFKGVVVYQWAYCLCVNANNGCFNPRYSSSYTNPVGVSINGDCVKMQKRCLTYGFCL